MDVKEPMEKQLKNNLIFLLGCYRSGTSILGELISSFKDVVYFYEPSWLSKDIANNYLTGNLKAEARTELLLKVTKFQKLESAIYLIKTPAFTTSIRLLQEVFPDAKFVYIVRDGRSVAYSMTKFTWWDNLKEPYPFFAIPEDELKLWNEVNPLQRAFITWGSICKKFEQEFETSIFQIKYEDLVLKSKETLRYILMYLDAAKWDRTDRVIDIIHKNALKRFNQHDKFISPTGLDMLKYYHYI